MKLTQFVNVLMITLAVCAVAGCKKNPKGVTVLPGHGRVGPGDMGPGEILQSPRDATATEGIAVPIVDPRTWEGAVRDEQMFAGQTVYFAYDSSAIRSGEKSKIASVADYLKANANSGVEVQGHCDERGTDEYNRALGERRALAVREELIAQGIDGSRVMTVSFGRSRPADTGHSDEAHAKNRRGQFVLLTK